MKTLKFTIIFSFVGFVLSLSTNPVFAKSKKLTSPGLASEGAYFLPGEIECENYLGETIITYPGRILFSQGVGGFVAMNTGNGCNDAVQVLDPTQYQFLTKGRKIDYNHLVFNGNAYSFVANKQAPRGKSEHDEDNDQSNDD